MRESESSASTSHTARRPLALVVGIVAFVMIAAGSVSWLLYSRSGTRLVGYRPDPGRGESATLTAIEEIAASCQMASFPLELQRPRFDFQEFCKWPPTGSETGAEPPVKSPCLPIVREACSARYGESFRNALRDHKEKCRLWLAGRSKREELLASAVRLLSELPLDVEVEVSSGLSENPGPRLLPSAAAKWRAIISRSVTQGLNSLASACQYRDVRITIRLFDEDGYFVGDAISETVDLPLRVRAFRGDSVALVNDLESRAFSEVSELHTSFNRTRFSRVEVTYGFEASALFGEFIDETFGKGVYGYCSGCEE